MKSKEKRNFLLGSLILVLAISIGYFGISSVKDTYALTCDGTLIGHSCCPSAYSYNIVNRGGTIYCINAAYSSSDTISASGFTYTSREVDTKENTKPNSEVYYTCIGGTYIPGADVYRWTCQAKTGVLPIFTADKICTINYSLNGGSNQPTSTRIIESGTLTMTKPTKSGYTFGGWSINGNTYKSGATYTCVSSGDVVVATAIWKQDLTCTSSYLESGCNGSLVETLQKKLNAVQGCGLDVDGGYGAKTESCVSSFQRSFGLSVDGVAGTDTNSKLNTLYNNITVSLNSSGATSKGTTSIYSLYNRGYYLDSSNSKKMSSSSNGITIPSKSYTITYNYNDNVTKNTTKNAACAFGGYYTKTSGQGTQFIGSTGFLTSGASVKNFTSSGTLYAKWGNCSLKLGNPPSRSGYTFLGWSNDSKSTNPTMKAGDTQNFTAATTLYAIWKANTSATTTYTIKFDANGGEGTTEEVKCTYGSNCTLTTNAFTKDGYVFNGWNTKKDGTGISYNDKNVVKDLSSTDGSTIILYAKWKQEGVDVKTYEVTFKYNDNVTKDKVVDVDENDTVSIIEPSRTGYTFDGWYTDEDLTKKYDFTSKVTSDFTLFGKWIANSSSTDKTDDEISTNSNTGDIMMFIAWTIGFGALAYSIYYYKTRKES